MNDWIMKKDFIYVCILESKSRRSAGKVFVVKSMSELKKITQGLKSFGRSRSGNMLVFLSRNAK